MNTFFDELIHNQILITGCVAWVVSQIIKTVIHLIVHKRLVLERLFGDGGMPSSHTATVTSLATATGLVVGFGSPLFALAAFFAIIVMHDARGVRYETGKQAKAINSLMDMMDMFALASEPDLTPEERLKEFVGHSPLQVFMGAILGIAIGLLLNL